MNQLLIGGIVGLYLGYGLGIAEKVKEGRLAFILVTFLWLPLSQFTKVRSPHE